MSPVLKYHDGTAWVGVSSIGPQGSTGPSGPTGPMVAGIEEVAIADAAPADPTLDLWVDTVAPDPTLFIDELTDVDTSTTAPVAGDALMWNGGLWTPGVAGLQGDFLPKTGGTLTGSLMLYADPALPQEAATKQYVDQHPGAVPTTYNRNVPNSPLGGFVHWNS